MKSANPFRKKRGALAYRRGLWAEAICRFFLRVKGYRILASRYKTPQGEIDIVGQKGSFLVFVEVKARPDDDQAAGALLQKQKTRLTRAAAHFLSRHPHLSTLSSRFDVMLVTPWRWPQHLSNAFWLE